MIEPEPTQMSPAHTLPTTSGAPSPHGPLRRKSVWFRIIRFGGHVGKATGVGRGPMWGRMYPGSRVGGLIGAIGYWSLSNGYL